jgi:signal peptidase II
MREKLRRAYEKVHAQRFVLQALIIAVAVAADQITKYLIMSAMTPQQTIPVVGNILRLTYILNEGASFGLFQGARIFFLIATAVTLVVLVVYMVRARKKQPLWLRVCLSLITAGAAGNFIDRIYIGKVRDFIDISGLGFPWIFNVADSCLVVGSIMLGIYLLFIYKEKDGKPLFARRDKKKDELFEGDEHMDGEKAEPEADGEPGGEGDAGKKPKKAGDGE